MSIQIFRFSIFDPLIQNQTDLLKSYLSEEEKRRMRRYFKPEDQLRFLAARGILKKILGSRLRQSPKNVVLEYGQYGKPIHQNIRFSVAHSRDHVALGFTTLALNIGIDLQFIKPATQIQRINRRFLHPKEAQWMQGLSPSDYRTRWFELWALKEAWLKATGAGIQHGLQTIAFHFDQTHWSIMEGPQPRPITLQSEITPCGYAIACVAIPA